MGINIGDMARFLPEKVTIAKTPDLIYSTGDVLAAEINMETVELKTIDVIAAFMALKEQAMAEAYRIKTEQARITATNKIRSMAHFKPIKTWQE